MPDDTSDAPSTEAEDTDAAGVVDETAANDATDPDPVTWKAPSAALVPVEQSGDAPPAPAKRSVLATVLATVALALIVALGVLTFLLWDKVDDLEDDVAANQTSSAEIEASARSAAESAVEDAVEPVQDQVDELKDQIESLEAAIDAVRAAQAGGASNADLAALTARLESVIQCVNRYMDTVSAATNAGTSYQYEICR